MDLDVVFVTWPNHPRRLEYLKRCVAAVKSRLTATGYDLRFICCSESQRDPDCPWMGDELTRFCEDSGIMLRWRPAPAGLGRNMNFAMMSAEAPVYLLVQDDWEMHIPCDIGPGADFLREHSGVCMIRYSWPGNLPTFIEDPSGWRRIDLHGKWPYGDDPSLRRKDFIKKYGPYLEECRHGSSEGNMLHRLVACKADIRVNDVCCFGHMGAVPAVPEKDDPRGYEPRRLKALTEG